MAGETQLTIYKLNSMSLMAGGFCIFDDAVLFFILSLSMVSLCCCKLKVLYLCSYIHGFKREFTDLLNILRVLRTIDLHVKLASDGMRDRAREEERGRAREEEREGERECVCICLSSHALSLEPADINDMDTNMIEINTEAAVLNIYIHLFTIHFKLNFTDQYTCVKVTPFACFAY